MIPGIDRQFGSNTKRGARAVKATWIVQSEHTELTRSSRVGMRSHTCALLCAFHSSKSAANWLWRGRRGSGGGGERLHPCAVDLDERLELDWCDRGTAPRACRLPETCLARDLAVTRTDSSGNLWLFGGTSFVPGVSDQWLNDLWMFNPSGVVDVGERAERAYAGVYGIWGPCGRQRPGALRSSRLTDSSGNFWPFGGNGYDSTGANAELDDLWRYSPGDGLWTWVSGSSTGNAQGVYGSEGIAAPGNVPPAREGAVAWSDASGNLWLFGGEQPGDPTAQYPQCMSAYCVFNDLWEYNPATGLWVWVSGLPRSLPDGLSSSTPPAPRGVASETPPMPRAYAASWSDALGNLWLFGGEFDMQCTCSAFMNDLWEFTPSTGLWTWVSGAIPSTATDAPRGVYGTEGIPAPDNVPGARRMASAWIDSEGHLWLFGGQAGTNWPGYNDLWRFDPRMGLWTWMSGGALKSESGFPGVYGTKGVAAPGNVPGSRSGSAAWIDNQGHLWLFGGYGFPSGTAPLTNTGSLGLLNDLWEFDR
jgi:hypothetical protein